MTWPQPIEVTTDGWIPSLIEIRRWGALPSPDGDYWQKFGFQALDFPADCPLLSARRPRLEQLFNGRYDSRLISYETVEIWQERLQYKTDEIAYMYERMYRLYDKYSTNMEDVIEKRTSNRAYTNANSGEDGMTTQSTAKDADTPDTTINISDDWGDSVSKQSSSATTTYGKTVSGSDDTTVAYEGDATGRVDMAINRYRNLDADFVREYEGLFMNVFEYRCGINDKGIFGRGL